jgi:hypothetical protein
VQTGAAPHGRAGAVTGKEKAMSEIAGKKNKERERKDAVPVEAGPIEEEGPAEVAELEGFSPEEFALLLKVKHDIAEGRYSDITNEHRKLIFAKWLVGHGKLEK